MLVLGRECGNDPYKPSPMVSQGIPKTGSFPTPGMTATEHQQANEDLEVSNLSLSLSLLLFERCARQLFSGTKGSLFSRVTEQLSKFSCNKPARQTANAGFQSPARNASPAPRLLRGWRGMAAGLAHVAWAHFSQRNLAGEGLLWLLEVGFKGKPQRETRNMFAFGLKFEGLTQVLLATERCCFASFS